MGATDALRRVGKNRHIVMAGVWVVLTVPTVLWWKDSILWVLIISLYANFASEVAAHQAQQARRET